MVLGRGGGEPRRDAHQMARPAARSPVLLLLFSQQFSSAARQRGWEAQGQKRRSHGRGPAAPPACPSGRVEASEVILAGRDPQQSGLALSSQSRLALPSIVRHSSAVQRSGRVLSSRLCPQSQSIAALANDLELQALAARQVDGLRGLQRLAGGAHIGAALALAPLAGQAVQVLRGRGRRGEQAAGQGRAG